MNGIISFGKKRTYEEFKLQIPEHIFPLFDSVREYCLSLGKNVIEDVRMHRIVFGKSMTFRWFADVEPQIDSVIIKIQKNRKEQPKIIEVKNNQEISEITSIIKNAFEEIH